MEMPDAVKWLLPIVVGESWPEGDETKLRALRDAWHAASSAITPVVDTGNQASKEILANWTGDAAQAYAEQWKKFVDGDEAFFKQLTDATKALGDSCDQTALDVEYTKYMIIISLVILAAQIVAMIAAAAVTFGGSTAGIAPAQIATRMTVQMLFRQLLEKLAQQGFKQVAKELLEKLLKQGLKKIGMEILKNEAMNLGMDAGIQGLQMAKGDRKDWDWAKTKDAAISGAVGGVVGAASGSIGKGATGALSHSAAGEVLDSAVRAGTRGAVEGVAQTVGQAAVTGKLGELTPEQLLMGASSGAVGGAVGGAKEQLKAIHEANIPHTEPGGGAHEPSSRDESSPEPRRESESRSEAEPESRSEPETRQESAPSSERQTPERQESAPQQRQENSPEQRVSEPSRAPEHQEAAPRHAAEAPESAPQRAPESAPEASPHRAESGPAPSSDHTPAPERPAAAASEPTPQPEHRAAPQQSDAPAPHQQPPPAGGPAPGSGSSPGTTSPSHGGYGMAPNSGGGAPANFGDPRQTGGRMPQENVGASGFVGGQNVPPHDGGFGPAQPAAAPPPPPQGPPPGGMPPAAPPPGGMAGPRQGGPGPRPGGPMQPPPMPPRGGMPPHGDPRRTPPPPQNPRQDPRARQAPPPNGGPPPYDPRRMPPQDPRYRPMPQGGPPQRPPVGPPPPGRGPGGGYPPRPPQGPPPGGRPPGPPQGPPGRPMHDPRFGPPRPGMPPQVPGPRHGAPPPEHWQRGPQDRTPPQPPMPHEQPRPMERAPEPPRPPQERVPEQPRQEPVPVPEKPAELPRDIGIEKVNAENYHSPDALENGYRTNAGESLVAFERRMNGEDAVAAPDPDGIGHRQSLDHVGEQLGKSWTTREDFDGITRELGERPVGARSAVSYEEHIPAKEDAPARVESRMVAAIKTEDGIVFADPRTGQLADLPEHAQQIQSMPLGGDEAPHHVPAEHSISDRLLGGPVERPVHDEGYLFDPEHRATPADHQSIGRTVGDEQIFDRIKEDALARRDASKTLGHLSDDGAIAIHTYTHEHAYSINEANRAGPGHPGFELAQQNTRAITDGLRQIQPQSGTLIRGVDTQGNHRVADLVAGAYVKGEVAVETTLTSATIETPGVKNHFGDDVVLHIRSDNIRDVSSISQNRSEGESISPPATQLLIHDKRLEIGPGGKRTWVIEAEEIGPGHPRHLDRETAEQRMAESRARHVENAPEIARLKQQAAMSRLDGLVESPPHTDLPTEAPPHTEPTPESVQDVPDTTPEPGPVPEHGWSELSRATNPPSEPAIHADTASPEQRAAYVRERHPQLAEVNPHFHDPDALEQGYRSNCVNGAEAYVNRLRGGDMTAEPLLVADMETRGTLEHIEGRFGERFSDRADYDAVIREMREMPVDHHAVVAVKYVNANGVELGHVAMVVHTRDGVAFIDPQSGDLMHLPQPPKGIRLMHVGVPETAGMHPEHVSAEHAHGGYGTAEPNFLARDDVAAALDGHADADFIREHLPRHPELLRAMAEPGNEYLTRSLLDNPKTIASLLKHPEAIPLLTNAVDEVNARGYDVIRDVHEAGNTEFDPTPDQAEIADGVRETAGNATAGEKRHASFDQSRIGDPEYPKAWVAEERAKWPENQRKLNDIVERIAGETGGEAGARTEPKDDKRALAKIAKYGGDGSRLNDLVGAKIQFSKVADLYAALGQLQNEPGLKIVHFEDRFATPEESGYRDLQMKVQLPNGHVAELRLHLTHMDDVAAYEHALFEVRRDFETLSRKEGREGVLSPEERALYAALIEQVRPRFDAALRKGLPDRTEEA